MRYDDILHEAFIASINALLSNPVNNGIKQELVIEQAWNVAVGAANKAKNSSTLIPKFRNTAVAAVPADAVVTISPTSGVRLNNTTTVQSVTTKPTGVTSPDGDFIPKR